MWKFSIDTLSCVSHSWKVLHILPHISAFVNKNMSSIGVALQQITFFALGSPCIFITEYIIQPLHLSVRMCFIASTHISQIIADCVVNKFVFDKSHPTNVFLWKKRTSLLDWLHQHGLLLKSLVHVGGNNFLTWPLIWRRKTQKKCNL